MADENRQDGRTHDGRFGAGNRAARKPRSIAELAIKIGDEITKAAAQPKRPPRLPREDDDGED